MGTVSGKIINKTKDMTVDIEISSMLLNQLTDEECMSMERRKEIVMNLFPKEWDLDDDITVTGLCGMVLKFDSKSFLLV